MSPWDRRVCRDFAYQALVGAVIAAVVLLLVCWAPGVTP